MNSKVKNILLGSLQFGMIAFIIVIICAVIYAGWVYGRPILINYSEHSKNLPTIEKLSTECNELKKSIDSLTNENKNLLLKIQLQNEIISTNKNSMDMQKKIQNQLEKLENRISNTEK